jgi:peptidoglycan hydrolase-like protein with peptidoglycan-binding domain
MRFNLALRMAAEGSLAAMLIAGAGLLCAAPAQTAQPKKPAPKAAPKKAPVRRVARPRAQTTPTKDRIVEIQEALAREGFYSGKPSGKWDATTSQAMKNFQTSQGLTATGKLGAQSLQKLGLGSDIAGKGAPLPQADTRPSVLSETELNEPEPKEP